MGLRTGNARVADLRDGRPRRPAGTPSASRVGATPSDGRRPGTARRPDPPGQVRDLGVGQLLLRRHLLHAVGVADRPQQQALVRLAHAAARPDVAALLHRRGGVEPQVGPLLLRPVALEALLGQDRPDCASRRTGPAPASAACPRPTHEAAQGEGGQDRQAVANRGHAHTRRGERDEPSTGGGPRRGGPQPLSGRGPRRSSTDFRNSILLHARFSFPRSAWERVFARSACRELNRPGRVRDDR